MNGETLDKRLAELRKEYKEQGIREQEAQVRMNVVQKYGFKVDRELPMGGISTSSPGFLPMMFDQT